jgi:hypothetical protein
MGRTGEQGEEEGSADVGECDGHCWCVSRRKSLGGSQRGGDMDDDLHAAQQHGELHQQ